MENFYAGGFQPEDRQLLPQERCECHKVVIWLTCRMCIKGLNVACAKVRRLEGRSGASLSHKRAKVNSKSEILDGSEV